MLAVGWSHQAASTYQMAVDKGLNDAEAKKFGELYLRRRADERPGQGNEIAGALT